MINSSNSSQELHSVSNRPHYGMAQVNRRQRVDHLLHTKPGRWRSRELAGRSTRGQSTGFSELDAILPGQAWPRLGLMEIISPRWGIGELQLLLPLMRSVVAQGQWILWLSPPCLGYSPALAHAGINTEHVLALPQKTSCKDALKSLEKALQTESCGLVLAWQNWLPGNVLRRLQSAAAMGNTLGVIFKHKDSKYSPSLFRLKIKESPQITSCNKTEITLITARGHCRSSSVRLNLYPHFQPPA